MVVDDINHWLNTAPFSIPDATQLREAADSITSNIREAFGREMGPDRNRFLVYSRSSAEETDERLRNVEEAHMVSKAFYWRQHHRLVVINRMLTSLMKRRPPPAPKPRRRRRPKPRPK